MLLQVLEVPATVSDEELKAARRRVALAVHPDKCTTPGANEATGRVNEVR